MVDPAPDTCPKCGTPRRDPAGACEKCGLASARMAAFAARRDAEVPAVVAAGWDAAVAGWAEARRHDALLQLASQHDSFAWVAGRYRDARRTGGYRDIALDPEIADRELARLRRAAEAQLMATARVREDKTPTPYRATIAILAMLVIAIVAGLVFARLFGKEPPRRNEAIPAPPLAPRT